MLQPKFAKTEHFYTTYVKGSNIVTRLITFIMFKFFTTLERRFYIVGIVTFMVQ